jgi:outer membrane lipoprotein SlyB
MRFCAHKEIFPMGKKPIVAAVMATILSSGFAPVAAFAQDQNSGRYDRRADDVRTYRGDDGRYYRCKRSKGTTGTIAGGAGGAVVAGALGASTLGTVAAGVGGALLGRHLDKKHDQAQNRENGC